MVSKKSFHLEPLLEYLDSIPNQNKRYKMYRNMIDQEHKMNSSKLCRFLAVWAVSLNSRERNEKVLTLLSNVYPNQMNKETKQEVIFHLNSSDVY